MAINVCGSSNDILAPCFWPLILLILSYKMLEFCSKRLHGNEHIFGIMHNLTYDIHVTVLNAHGCITRAFLRLRFILAFIIYFNGWSVVNLNQFCLVFWNAVHVPGLCFFIVFVFFIFIVPLIYFALFSTCFKARLTFFKRILEPIFLTLSLSKADGL